MIPVNLPETQITLNEWLVLVKEVKSKSIECKLQQSINQLTQDLKISNKVTKLGWSCQYYDTALLHNGSSASVIQTRFIRMQLLQLTLSHPPPQLVKV